MSKKIVYLVLIVILILAGLVIFNIKGKKTTEIATIKESSTETKQVKDDIDEDLKSLDDSLNEIDSEDFDSKNLSDL